MRRYLYIVLLLLVTISSSAQRLSHSRRTSSREVASPVLVATDSVAPVVEVPWQPDAVRATWMAALFPGLGQIYNRSYWKLPIVYGGLIGIGYAVGWNGNKYNQYRTAYRDLYFDIQRGTVSPDDPDKSYIALLPTGYTIDRMGGASNYMKTLNNGQNTYRRYRDLCIAATVLVYGLSIIDAFVDARLFDFDISPDLSMRAEPALYTNPFDNQRSVEAHFALTIK